jgi:asparagine synthase (glutamine-hydrolysing)
VSAWVIPRPHGPCLKSSRPRPGCDATLRRARWLQKVAQANGGVIDMCGICGWLDYERDLYEDGARSELAAMTATMACRGPDDEGTFVDTHAALGHRRLAVIDLPGGRQPMTVTENGRPGAAALVYSGETYNFRELRERLAVAGHRFETSSDTEVVLHAHREWGRRDPRDAVRELNGMFAYALWDAATQELVLVRDRLGIKPLYYYPTAHGVLFGSEPKAVLANGLAERVLDADGLRRALGFVADPHQAIFRGLREVPPGHVVRVSRAGISEQRYWALADTGHTDDVPTTVRHVRELLEDTARRQLVADVPLCTLLSGGLDSSALTALAARHTAGRVRSFAVDFTGYTENFTADEFRSTPDAPYVHEVAQFVGTEHTDITLSTDQLMDAGVRAATLHARDLPSGIGDMDTSLYLLFRSVRERSTVALSGESADEVFGGYREFHDLDTVAAGTFPWLAGRMMDRDPSDPGLWDPGLAKQLDLPGYLEGHYRTALAEVPALTGPSATDPHERRMREICYLYLTRFLPLLLERKDRMSMAVGLEVRVPFCDHRLVEYVFGAPWSHKTFDGREKSLLRAAAADLLPGSVVQRVKSPYPSTQDAGYERILRSRVSALLDADAPVTPLISVDAVRERLTAPEGAYSGMGARMRLEQVLSMNDWLSDYAVTLDV